MGAFLYFWIVLLVWTGNVWAQEQTRSGPALSSWVVYWDFAPSLEAAVQHASIFNDLGVFCYQFDTEGRIVPGSAALEGAVPKLRALLPREKLSVWVSVTNDVGRDKKRKLKDPAIVHRMVSKPARRSAHIQELLAIAAGADGLEIDYENLWARDHDLYPVFVRELAAALHHRGQRLAVVVQAKTNDRIRNEAGAIDWASVAASADVVKVMAYHFHYASGTPGPIAPPEWVAAVTKFALERIPREKLVIVLTLSGFDWPRGGIGRALHFQEATRIAMARQIAIQRDSASDSPHFAYNENGIAHEVWFEDAASLQRKLQTLQELGVLHVGFWRLGTGDPAFWSTHKNLTR